MSRTFLQALVISILLVFLEVFVGFYLATSGVAPPEVTHRAVVAFAAYGLAVHTLIFIPILYFEKSDSQEASAKTLESMEHTEDVQR
jgi:heme A synthase